MVERSSQSLFDLSYSELEQTYSYPHKAKEFKILLNSVCCGEQEFDVPLQLYTASMIGRGKVKQRPAIGLLFSKALDTGIIPQLTQTYVARFMNPELKFVVEELKPHHLKNHYDPHVMSNMYDSMLHFGIVLEKVKPDQRSILAQKHFINRLLFLDGQHQHNNS